MECKTDLSCKNRDSGIPRSYRGPTTIDETRPKTLLRLKVRPGFVGPAISVDM